MTKKKQKQIFLESEGDSYFKRNQKSIERETPNMDSVLNEILALKKSKAKTQNSVLEIGCSSGKRLIELKKAGYQVSGVDPSKIAIAEAIKNGIDAKIGTADELPFEDHKFDIVVFGFCLYVCDRDDLFKIAAEANRVLKEDGYVIIFDFFSKDQTSNSYHHKKGIHSYKMDYSKLFDWHPNYTLIKQTIGSHIDFSITDNKDDQVAISVIRKKN